MFSPIKNTSAEKFFVWAAGFCFVTASHIVAVTKACCVAQLVIGGSCTHTGP
jgi:hypothetical protein